MVKAYSEGALKHIPNEGDNKYRLDTVQNLSLVECFQIIVVDLFAIRLL